MTQGKGFWSRVPAALCILTGAMLLAILAILTLGQGAFGYAYQNLSLLGNLQLLPVSLALGLAWAFFLSRAKPRTATRRDTLWLMLFQLALLAVQLVATRSLWFYAGWDVGNVDAMAVELAQGVPLSGLSNYPYYGYCTNNAPVTLLLAAPAWIGVKLGMAVPYGILPYFCACVHNLTGLLTTLCVRRLVSSRRALWSAVAVTTIWVGLHLYMTVPYTDVFGAFFVALALYVALSDLKPFPKAALFTFACFFGASIKPPVAILFIAAALIALARALSRGRRGWDASWRKRALIVLAAAVIGFVPARIWQTAATTYLAGSAKPEGELTMTHYLMIGQNDESLGGHSQTDLELSRSIESRAERERTNVEIAASRVAQRGLLGNLRFYAIKAFKAYNDGTFAAGSSLLVMEKPRREDALSGLLRSVFYGGQSANGAYATAEQAIWLMLLALCACAALLERDKRPLVALLSLTVLGLTLYQLLMEVWPRYLYIFWPVYALLAIIGAEGLGGRIGARRAAKPEPR